MDQPGIRWQQRFGNLQTAYRRLQHAIAVNEEQPGNELVQMALIKAFEMTFELSWKTIKDYLKFNGIDAKLPREAIKQAFAHDIVVDGQMWIDMLEDRNLMAHTYDRDRALLAVERIVGRYRFGLAQLHDYFAGRLSS